jgi:hypothetical protein
VTIDSERQKESTQKTPALTRHKIISHGQDHHGGSGQDRNSWLLDPQASAACPKTSPDVQFSSKYGFCTWAYFGGQTQMVVSPIAKLSERPRQRMTSHRALMLRRRASDHSWQQSGRRQTLCCNAAAASPAGIPWPPPLRFPDREPALGIPLSTFGARLNPVARSRKPLTAAQCRVACLWRSSALPRPWCQPSLVRRPAF